MLELKESSLELAQKARREASLILMRWAVAALLGSLLWQLAISAETHRLVRFVVLQVIEFELWVTHKHIGIFLIASVSVLYVTHMLRVIAVLSALSTQESLTPDELQYVKTLNVEKYTTALMAFLMGSAILAALYGGVKLLVLVEPAADDSFVVGVVYSICAAVTLTNLGPAMLTPAFLGLKEKASLEQCVLYYVEKCLRDKNMPEA